jgi:hypothetical protein
MKLKKIHMTIACIFYCISATYASSIDHTFNVFSIGGGEQKGGQFCNTSVLGETFVLDRSYDQNEIKQVNNSVGFIFLSGSSPMAPTDLYLDPSFDSGESDHDNITNKTNGLIISGFGYDSAKIFLYDNDSDIPLTEGDVIDGKFSIPIDLTDDGKHVISARQLINGNISDVSDPIEIIIDTIKPQPPVLMELAPEDDSGEKDNLTNHTKDLTIHGTGEKNTQLSLSDNGKGVYNKSWLDTNSFMVDINIDKDGTYSIMGQLEDSAGNISELSDALIITIDTKAPRIEIKKPQEMLSYNDLFSIMGTSVDEVSKIVSLELQISGENEGQIYYVNPKEEWVSESTWISLPAGIQWTFKTLNLTWWSDEWYTILLKATDAANNTEMAITTFGIDIEYPTNLTLSFSKDTIVLGEQLLISGKLTPEQQSTSGDTAELLVSLVMDDDVKKSLSFSTQVSENFIYEMPCHAFPGAGDWVVKVHWNGMKDKYKGCQSSQLITVQKAQLDLSLQMSYQKIKLYDDILLKGKIENNPLCPDLVSGLSVTFLLTGPESKQVSLTTVSDEKGFFDIQSKDFIDELGQWDIIAEFQGNDSYSPTQSQAVRLDVVETAGYAVIIQGRNDSKEGLEPHLKTVNYIYQTFINRGFLEKDIKRFRYFENDHLNQPFTKQGIYEYIQNDISQKMNTLPANFYLVMVDHGEDETFLMDPESITATKLSEWLDELYGSNLNEKAREQETIVAIGACKSGSFIKKLSGSNRIIITSASIRENSVKGKADADGILVGDYFIHEFFKSIANGQSIKQSFKEASILTYSLTYDQSIHNYAQHPLIDDNGDGVGTYLDEDAIHMDSDIISMGGDGFLLANNLYVGTDPLSFNTSGPLQIIDHTPTIFLKEDENTTMLWAKVNDNTNVKSIWIEIKSPHYQIVSPDNPDQTTIQDPERIDGKEFYNELTNRYEWHMYGYFTEPGTYQILYYVEDIQQGKVSLSATGWVYKNKSGNEKPSNFNLLSPLNGANVKAAYVTNQNAYYILFDWNESTDEDYLTYTVNFSINPDLSNPISFQRLNKSTLFVEVGNQLMFNTNYYWNVTAIDEYGLSRQTEIWSFKILSENLSNTGCLLKGCVYHINTGKVIPHATVSSTNASIGDNGNGCFGGIAFFGDHNILAQADFFHSTEMQFTVNTSLSKRVNIKLSPMADLDHNGRIDMKDVIKALQILCNFIDSEASNIVQEDISQDGKIGLIELMYIMHITAEIE